MTDTENRPLKYLVVGAGGTGGCLGAFLTRGGRDVTLIARGDHLRAIRETGLSVENGGRRFTVRPRAATAEEYAGAPDVAFLCVKAYALDALVPFLRRLGEHVLLIPLLNIFTTGEKLQALLPRNPVADGCIYIAANLAACGELAMHGDIFRVVFGVRDPADFDGRLPLVRDDLNACGIEAVLSGSIRRDALLKFSYVSAQAACGLYYGVPAGPIQSDPEIRACFAALVGEIVQLAAAQGVRFGEDAVARNLAILDALQPDSSTSLQRDVGAGKPSEIDGQIFEVVRLADRCGLELPVYRRIAAELERRTGRGAT